MRSGTRLLARQNLPLRDPHPVLLHESAARAEEVLALDVDELDLRNRRQSGASVVRALLCCNAARWSASGAVTDQVVLAAVLE